MFKPYLKTTLQEIFSAESQHVIELHAGVVQDTDADETTDKSVTLEETLRVFLLESQELTGSTTIPMLASPVPSPGIHPQSPPQPKTGERPYRILESVSWTLQTSLLLRRPYSPTVFNSASLNTEFYH